MIFTEIGFLPFFALVFVVAWVLPWNTARKWWLVLASYAFYAAWDWRFLGLLVASTIVDFVAGLAIARSRSAWARRAWLGVSLAANLGVLALFKYFDFFAHSAAELARAMGHTLSVPTLGLILPLGISFYTFEKLSYTIDIYRGTLKPTRRPEDFALFVSFFPRLVAGPIMRAAEFLPQLADRPRWASVDVRACVMLFLAGYFKKACVSDTIAPAVDAYFAEPGTYTPWSGVLAVVLYATQIYADFSGYTDMARAAAGLLGYNLPLNFRHPYLASSITEFWRRWHISLSSWLRDYLYISLGGNRGSTLATYRNLLLTMLLGGLWHGANWTFVVWGAIHGVALALHKLWTARVRMPLALVPAARPAGVALTFYVVCVAWIFFRAPTLADAWDITGAFVLLSGEGTVSLSPRYVVVLVVVLALHVWSARGWGRGLAARAPWWLFALVAGLLAGLLLTLSPSGVRPFIYFQF